jgi:hypothetical protein
MRERTSPRTIIREIRARIPDALMTLREVPHILQTAVREAAQGAPVPVQAVDIAELQAETRRLGLRRETAIAAGVLWLSGLIWLAGAGGYRWLGWLQLCAGILLFVRMRSSKLRIE